MNLPSAARPVRLPQSVQVFLARMEGGEREYLLLHRVERPDLALPAFWQGVSGAVETGESFAQAAVREVSEETAIALPDAQDTGFEHSYPIKPEWRSAYGPGPDVVVERVLVALLADPVDPVLSAEHQAWRWCRLQEAIDLLSYGENARCIAQVEAWLARAAAR